MKQLLLLPGLLACTSALAQTTPPAPETAPVMVRDFEKLAAPPTVWVVNIPNESASVRLSSERPFEGRQSLSLRYRFSGEGQ